MARRPTELTHAMVEAAMRLAAERGWADVSYLDIVQAAKVPLAQAYAGVPSKPGVLEAFARQIDTEVLAGTAGPEPEDTPRDRLFDTLMRRFDALAPYKQAVGRIAADLPRDPLTAAAVAPQALRSVAWMLVAAGIPTVGLRGKLRIKGLAVVWLAVQRVWLEDEDPDLGQTMAALDRNLRRADTWLGLTAGADKLAPTAEATAS